MRERLNELVQNEVFMKRLLALDTDVEVQALLAENDVELSLDEIKFIKKQVEARLNGQEELDEEDLANVVGGSMIAVAIIGAVVAGIVKLGDSVHKWTNGKW